MCLQLKNSNSIRSTCTSLVIWGTALLLTLSVVSPSVVYSRPFNLPLPGGGPVPRLPAAHEAVLVGASMFFFLDGIFYKKGPEGYVVASAPVGAHITALPQNVVPVPVDGAIYYVYNGVYYSKLPNGYVVVNAPAQVNNSAVVKYERLRVVVGPLNVRSGPGLGYSIIDQVKVGQILEVQSTGIDWVYIKLPNNANGWVKREYTTNEGSVPVG